VTEIFQNLVSPRRFLEPNRPAWPSGDQPGPGAKAIDNLDVLGGRFLLGKILFSKRRDGFWGDVHQKPKKLLSIVPDVFFLGRLP